MEKLRKKQTFYLIVLILISLLIAGGIVVSIIYIDHMVISTLTVLSLIVLLLVLYYFKTKYDFYTLRYQHIRLKDEANEPIGINTTMNLKTIQLDLEKNGYQLFTENAEYKLLYKIDNKKKKRKHRILYATLIFLNSDLNFDDSYTNTFFQSLENQVQPKEKYKQRIFYQIKINDKEDTSSANNNLFVSSRNENYVFINVLFNNNEKFVYYLHSNTFSPNRYYTLGISELKNLFEYHSIK